MKRLHILLSLACMLALSPAFAQQTAVSLEKKVAQMLVIGLKSPSADSMTLHLIRDKGIGGVILFEKNITPVGEGTNSVEDLKALCSALQSASPEKLIISIDQEGGRVNRLKTKYGFPASVTAQYLGEADNADTTRYYYAAMAETLSDAGINLNFGPVVDVNVNPDCPVIGKFGRSYSAHPEKVEKHARLFVEEHHKRGVRTALKHFPGHGSSTEDTHAGFVDATRTWERMELRPYRYMMKHSLCDIVMVSHVVNARIDPVYPATLSRLTVDSLLRKKMKYSGLVMTDDLTMRAITDNYPFPEALALAINAGVDMLIVSGNIPGAPFERYDGVIDLIVALVRDGTIPQRRIDESYARIQKFKREMPDSRL